MKLVLLAGTAFLGLAASGPAARAVPIDFTYTGSLVTFTVPTTDTYQILAFGAQGGTSVGVGEGGRGAEIGGDFVLTANEVLQIAVGGAGVSRGGGGGSFVVGPGNTPLVIAGGGGGGGVVAVTPLPGQGGLTGPDGGGQGGGTGGNGGAQGLSGAGGGGGGGFFSPGEPIAGLPTGGGAFPGLAGGVIGGGFGGGGGAFAGSGGGGGYSGGAGGGRSALGLGPGGGGGSFDAGTDQILVADFQAGNGEVIITELAVAAPEPASIALLGAGLLSLAVMRRRRRPET